MHNLMLIRYVRIKLARKKLRLIYFNLRRFQNNEDDASYSEDDASLKVLILILFSP